MSTRTVEEITADIKTAELRGDPAAMMDLIEELVVANAVDA